VKDLVKVTFKPWEEVVIHETIKYTLSDLIARSSLGVQPGGLAAPLNWAEGVAFGYESMLPNDEITRELLQGKVHWNVVGWALMPDYKNVILIADINAKIPVIDVSADAILCEIAKALKGQPQQ
jgi:glutamine cyclotransferase